MENSPAPPPASNDQTSGTPEPEVLKPRTDEGAPDPTAEITAAPTPTPESGKPPRRRTYRPSHKATFIGLGVVVLILAINAGILGFLLKSNAKTSELAKGQVTISQAALDKIGVNRSTVGDSGIELVVGPNARFSGKMTVAGDVNIAGQLKLNSKFSASDAVFTQLEAGDTSLGQLNVSGKSTLSSLDLRNTLAVTGTTQLLGAVTIGQLLTVNNNLNVAKNLAVGGALSVNAFVARSLASTSTLTIAGHIITGGATPSAGPGSALGNNGTIGISGNDAAGTVSINIGTGASSGTLASVAFRTQYFKTPRIVITPVGVGANFYITNTSSAGFTIKVGSGLPPGGYAINYIVEQ